MSQLPRQLSAPSLRLNDEPSSFAAPPEEFSRPDVSAPGIAGDAFAASFGQSNLVVGFLNWFDKLGLAADDPTGWYDEKRGGLWLEQNKRTLETEYGLTPEQVLKETGGKSRLWDIVGVLENQQDRRRLADVAKYTADGDYSSAAAAVAGSLTGSIADPTILIPTTTTLPRLAGSVFGTIKAGAKVRTMGSLFKSGLRKTSSVTSATSST